MRRRAVLAVVPLLLAPVACGNDVSSDNSGSASGSLPGVTIHGEFGATPEVTVKDLSVTKPRSVVVSEGDGPDATTERQTLLDLVIINGTSGEQAYSTFETGQPFTLTPGSDQIKGLAAAVAGQPRGSRIAFESTTKDAFSDQGVPQLSLAATDAIVVVADILSVEPADPLGGPEGTSVDPAAGTPSVQSNGDVVTGLDWSKSPKKPSAKLQVIPLIEGDGPAIEAKRLVTFDYFGEVYGGTKAFDESFSKDPITFPLGVGGLIPAWDEGLIGVKEGSRVLIITPPGKAYGAQGSPPSIPPNATLAFVIDVLAVDG